VPWRFHLPYRAGSDEPAAPRTDVPGVEARAVAGAEETVRDALARQTRIVPLPRLVGPMTLTARIADFEASLAGPNGLAPVLRPPTVDRSTDAPGGLVWGFATPRGREPAERHRLAMEWSAGLPARAPRLEPAGAGAFADPEPPRRLSVVASPEPAHAYTRVDPDTLPAAGSGRRIAERTRSAGADAGEDETGGAPSEAIESGPSPAGVGRGARSLGAAGGEGGAQDGDRHETQHGHRADEAVAVETAAMVPADHRSLGRTRRLGLGAPLQARPAGTRSLAEPEIPDSLRPAPAAAPPPPARPARFAARTPVSGGLPVPLMELRATPPISSEPASPVRTAQVAPGGAARPAGSAAAPAGEGGRAATGSIQRLPLSASPADRRQPESTGLAAGTATGRTSNPTAGRTVASMAEPAGVPPRPLSALPPSAPGGDRTPSPTRAAARARPAPMSPGPPSDATHLAASPNHPSLELARPAAPSGVHRAPNVLLDVESAASIQRSPIESVAQAAGPTPAIAAGSAPASFPARSGPAEPSRATALPATATGVTVFRQTAGTASAAPSGGQAQGEGSMSEDQIDHLAGQVYGRIRNRLEAELLRERERAGLLADFR
jgi:hypothetical protein